MAKEIRIGVAGYGHRGRGMLRLAGEGFEQVTPAAVCEINPALLDQAKKDHPDIALFDNVDRMIQDAGIHALIVETPATFHSEICSKALAANIHVMSDVPAVHSIEGGETLHAAVQRSRAIYMLGANPNMWGFVDAFADIKAKGLIGTPYYLEASYIHDVRYLFESTPWRATYESIRYCTHSLGPMLRLVDDDFEWVSCFDTGSHIDGIPGRHDAMVAIFRTSSGVTLRLLTTFINQCPPASGGHHYRVFGTKGCLERVPDPSGVKRTLFYSTEMSTEHKYTELPIGEMPPRYIGNAKAGGHGGADYALFDAFFDAIRNGKPSPINIREALRMTLPGIVAAESARRNGDLMKINYPWTEK